LRANSSATCPMCLHGIAGELSTTGVAFLIGRSYSSSELLSDNTPGNFLFWIGWTCWTGSSSLVSGPLVWVEMWRLQLLLVEKLLVQPSTVQTNGFSPVWDLMCCFKALFWFQRFPHPSNSQTNGFSPVWIRLWMSKWAGRRKDFPHPACSQTWGLAPWWCPRKWSTRLRLEVNSLWQSGAGQMNDLLSSSSLSSSSTMLKEAFARISKDITI